MRLAGWILLLTALLVGVGAVYLGLQVPFLEVPSPWGPLPLAFLLGGGYALGLLAGLAYALAFWARGVAQGRALRREIARLQGELNALKRERIEEIPRIPDRDEA
ncbi:hypothetical protein GCM10007092_00750 [Thermus composti]|uniref:Lipopolysaccharide assembly protein A domain-containing protein n=1 Tax=Thermus composti TaxID=532059 RepID=A0ABV6Q0X8_9DEIN|nr:hypothetical protein [Thermus composti]GGM91684.1 hypothetical protein GCM10007092_00750 [Thermus composti]